jgi:6-phosphogluconolactonase (cycloisomerase 2 family)
METKGNATMRRLGRVAAAVGVWALSLTVGCGNFWVYPGSLNNSSSSTGDYVYVANAPANGSTPTLAGFSVGTGTLTAVSGSPYSLTFVPTAVAVNPANTMVFVAGTNGIYGFVNSYSIGTGGALTLLKSNNLGSASMVSIDVSPDGSWLLGLDANGFLVNQAIVDEYQIESSGQLQQGSGVSYTFPTGAPAIVPKAIKISPENGQYVYVAVGTAGDLVFSFTTSSGAFGSSVGTLSTGATTLSDNGLAVSSSGSVLYIARSNGQSAGTVSAYSVGSGLAPVFVAQGTTGVQPGAVALDKAGTDLYVANRTDVTNGTISGFSVGGNGAPTALSPATYSSGLGVFPVALAVDNGGKYLLAVANDGSPDLAMYSESSGQLSFVASVATATDPAGAVAIAATH